MSGVLLVPEGGRGPCAASHGALDAALQRLRAAGPLEVRTATQGDLDREMDAWRRETSTVSCLVTGERLVRGGPLSARGVVFPRAPVRWHLRTPGGGELQDLPGGSVVAVPCVLAAALLRDARPDLETLVAPGGGEDPSVPSLVPVDPGDGHGVPLAVSTFPMPPGRGVVALLEPAGTPLPAAVAAMEDTATRRCFDAEAAFAGAAGESLVGPLLVHVRPLGPVLLALGAAAITGQGTVERFQAELPLVDARQFAAAFGRHFAERANKTRKDA